MTTKERLEAALRKAKKKLQRLEKRVAQQPEAGLDNGDTSVRSKEMALARKDMA